MKKLVERINEIGGVDFITIGGMGEPTLDKKLPQKLEFLKKNLKKNTLIQLHTNGSSSIELLRKLLPNVTTFSVSVNAALSKTHEYLTETKSYSQILKNLSFLAKSKSKHNYKIRLTLVKSKFLQKGEIKLFQRQFNRLADDIVLHDDKNWGSWKHRVIKYQRPCTVIWKTLSVNWDGTVRLCTEDFNRKYSLGDIKKHSIKEIFNSRLIVKARREHRKGLFGNSIKICKECSKTETNIFWAKLPIKHYKHKNFFDIILMNALKFKKMFNNYKMNISTEVHF